MSRWERWTTKPKEGMSLNKFIVEAGPGMGRAQQEAEQQGLQWSGFGWYTDPKSGKRVAKIVGDRLVQFDPQDPGSAGVGTTAATTDTGNPTTVGFKSPADKARSMGLQSDGSGGYVDPSTGEVVARTVNNELVFYSPQGGAISDGSAGEQLTQPSPAWVDPVTGELMMPPAQPESPEEKAAVPDHVPAQAPASYNGFMNAKRRELYAKNAALETAEEDIAAQAASVEERYNTSPAMQRLYKDMMGVIDRAFETGDKHKAAVATVLRDQLDSGSDDFQAMFDGIGEEDLQDLGTLVKRKTIADIKKQYYDDNKDDDSVPFDYYMAGTDSRELNDEINQIRDKNTELVKPPKFQKVPKEVSDGGIKYRIEPKKDRIAPGTAKEANDALREAGINYRVGDKPKVVSVDWDVEGADDEMDAEGNRQKLGPQESKRKALAALRTWRNEVLPRFSPGTIVHAEPMKEEGEGRYENQRARIYQLAGFGYNHINQQHPGMYGIVIENEDGENELLPISPTDEQKNKRTTQMESVYIRINDYQLNMVDTDVIVEMLLS